MREFYTAWQNEIKGAGGALLFFGGIVVIVALIAWIGPKPKTPVCPAGTVFISSSQVCVPGTAPVWK